MNKTIAVIIILVASLAGCKIPQINIPDIPPVIVPPVIVPPVTVTPTTTTTTTTTTQPAVGVVCSCSNEKSTSYVRYKADGTVNREVIITGYLPCELRALLNDGIEGKECGIADFVQANKAARIVDGKLFVDCLVLPDGSKAHYLGLKQPSSSSPMVQGQGVPVTGSLLRLYFGGRK